LIRERYANEDEVEKEINCVEFKRTFTATMGHILKPTT